MFSVRSNRDDGTAKEGIEMTSIKEPTGLVPLIFRDKATGISWVQCDKCGHKIFFERQQTWYKNFPIIALVLTTLDKCEGCGNPIRIKSEELSS